MCRIVSYNIHSGVGRDKKQDYKRIGKFLADIGADIVLLQEMDTRPSERSTEQDIRDICADEVFSLVKSPALEEPGGWYGNAVLSRYPVITNETLDVSQEGRQPRNIQAVEVETPEGMLTVINTHKGLKKRERRSQFAMLHEYIQKRMKERSSPIVVAGDFNEWQFFTRAFQAMNSTLTQHKVGATFPSQFPLFSLDRVWTSKLVQVLRCRKLKNRRTRLYSDHLPVQVDIQLLNQRSEMTR